MIRLGARHMQVIGAWLPTAAIYGASAGLAFTFVAEWRDVLQYLPYYNGKYPKAE